MVAIAQVLILVVALIHVYILVLEMFLWRTRARKIFKTTQEEADRTAVFAKNQGLYNGFLAAGLLWADFSPHGFAPRATFFLLCVAVAGIYGAVTVQRRILYVQTVPAALALAALWLS
jgi:putative membrane protein